MPRRAVVVGGDLVAAARAVETSILPGLDCPAAQRKGWWHWDVPAAAMAVAVGKLREAGAQPRSAVVLGVLKRHHSAGEPDLGSYR